MDGLIQKKCVVSDDIIQYSYKTKIVWQAFGGPGEVHTTSARTLGLNPALVSLISVIPLSLQVTSFLFPLSLSKRYIWL